MDFGERTGKLADGEKIFCCCCFYFDLISCVCMCECVCFIVIGNCFALRIVLYLFDCSHDNSFTLIICLFIRKIVSIATLFHMLFTIWDLVKICNFQN